MSDTSHIPGTGGTPPRSVRHVNSFIVILLLTVAVWLFVAMSESREFPLQVQVEMSGYDAERYAVQQADSAIVFQVQASGFSAMALGFRGEAVVLPVDMSAERIHRYQRLAADGSRQLHIHSVAVADLVEPLRQQLMHYGIRSAGSQRDSLRLVLAPRASKTLPVDISTLQVSFADGYGLYGEPVVSPAEVTLYGSQQALDRISVLRLEPAAIAGLTSTATHHLPLESVWQQYSGVSASVTHVAVTIPVSPYVERSFSLPVTVLPADSSLRLRLYPDRATVRFWVARDDVASVSPSQFILAVDRADILAGNAPLVPRLERFPDHVRVRSIEPSGLQYVIIQ